MSPSAASLVALLPRPVREVIRKAHYHRKLRRASPDQEMDLALALRLLQPGDAAVDVGANFGLYTRFFAEAVGPAGCVYAIEPIPPTFNVLRHNLEQLGLRNVTAINAAVSDRAATVVMVVPHLDGADNFYRAQIANDQDPEGKSRRFIIQAQPLDQLIPRDVPVALLKVDVEGHELQCMRGALGLIHMWAPALLVEANGDPDSAQGSLELFQMLRHLGYEAYVAANAQLVRRKPGERATNYFFLQARHTR